MTDIKQENKVVNTIVINVKNEDTLLRYYTSVFYTKLRCALSSRIFEAQEIIDDVYLGSVDSSFDFKELKSRGITHIISVAAGYIPPFKDEFCYMHIDTLDTELTELQSVFNAVYFYIENILDLQGKVLIHCVEGKSRSATVLAAYMVRKYGIDPMTCFNIMRNKRDKVDPNSKFLIELDKYYKKLYLRE